MKKFFISILLLAILGFAAFEGIYRYHLSASGTQTSTITFEIAKGESPKIVAKNLEEKNLISSAWAFLRFAKKENLDSKFQAGFFELNGTMTIEEMANALTKAEKNAVKITIPEGLTLEEMDELFAKKGILETGEFLECVLETCDFAEFAFLPKKKSYREGYFFASTYDFEKPKISAEYIGKQMLKAFEKTAKNLEILDAENLHEIVTMASIVEKEWANAEEGKLIAGVLWNRVNQKMQMGADATLRYAIGKKSAALTKDDLNIKDDFNTRRKIGLPPHAIAAPSEKALESAAHPKETDYLYYLHDKNRKIHLAKTNDEHNQNKWKFCGGSCE